MGLDRPTKAGERLLQRLVVVGLKATAEKPQSLGLVDWPDGRGEWRLGRDLRHGGQFSSDGEPERTKLRSCAGGGKH
jgi:hypothetical protein